MLLKAQVLQATHSHWAGLCVGRMWFLKRSPLLELLCLQRDLPRRLRRNAARYDFCVYPSIFRHQIYSNQDR